MSSQGTETPGAESAAPRLGEPPVLDVCRESSSSSSLATSGCLSQGTKDSTPSSATTPDCEARRGSGSSVEASDLSTTDTFVNEPDGRYSSGSNDPSRSVPAEQQTPNVQQVSATRKFPNVKSFRGSFSNVLQVLSLAVAAVGLLFLGWRGYKLAIAALWQTEVNNCFQQDASSSNKTNSECEKTLDLWKAGKLEPPYSLSKRLIEAAKGLQRRSSIDAIGNATNATFASLPGYSSAGFGISRSGTLDPEPPSKLSSRTWTVIVVSVVWFILYLALRMSRERRQTRQDGPPYTSVARNDFKDPPLTKHDGKHYKMDKLKAREDERLWALGERIRSSLSSDSSSRSSSTFSWTTLQSANTPASSISSQGSKGRKFSTQDGEEEQEEEHESVIQLPTKALTKVFFDPNTGEFIHLEPWKSHVGDEDDGMVEDGDTKQALAQMATGAVAFASGKRISDMIIEAFDQPEDDSQDKPSTADFMGDATLGAALTDSPKVGNDVVRQRTVTRASQD